MELCFAGLAKQHFEKLSSLEVEAVLQGLPDSVRSMPAFAQVGQTAAQA